MPRYPGAVWKPWPENATQPRGLKTQSILHSTADNGGALATWSYFNRADIVVESNFIVGFKGDALQGLDSACRADANYTANWRAISVETVGAPDEPWTDAQLQWLVDYHRWANTTHGIPLRIAPAHDQPGIGYHRLYPEWSPGPTSCPNDLRVAQFHDVLMPRLLTPRSDEMQVLLQGPDGAVWLSDLVTRRHVGSPDRLNDIVWLHGQTGGRLLADTTPRAVSAEFLADIPMVASLAAGADPAALAADIAGRLSPDVAAAVAAELARRLAF